MLRRAKKDFVLNGFAAYGALWLAVESFGAFFTGHKPEGAWWYFMLVAVSCVYGFVRAYPRGRVEVEIANSDSKLEIHFGDIFEKPEAIVIPVNEYFDSLLGDHVSERSLHGVFIRDVLGGQSNSFDDLIQQSLSKAHPIQQVRPSGKCQQYPIGTTAVAQVNGVVYFLVALSHTDIETLKASATIHDLWDALEGLWEAIRNDANGRVVRIPLIGSGLSGIGLPGKNLIDLILTSFAYFTKKAKIANKVSLTLPDYMSREIDLVSFERSWS